MAVVGKIKMIGMGIFLSKLSAATRMITIGKKSLNRSIGMALNREIEKTFILRGKGGGYQGKSWAALSPVTLDRRRKAGRSSRLILTDTRRYRKSFRPNNSETRFQITENSVRVGSNVPYAKYHEFGDGVKTRSILPTEKRAGKIAVIAGEDFLTKKLTKAGLSPKRIGKIVRQFK